MRLTVGICPGHLGKGHGLFAIRDSPAKQMSAWRLVLSPWQPATANIFASVVTMSHASQLVNSHQRDIEWAHLCETCQMQQATLWHVLQTGSTKILRSCLPSLLGAFQDSWTCCRPKFKSPRPNCFADSSFRAPDINKCWSWGLGMMYLARVFNNIIDFLSSCIKHVPRCRASPFVNCAKPSRFRHIRV